MSENKSLIGSDPAHTKWCRDYARKSVRDWKNSMGAAWNVLSRDTREDLVMGLGAMMVLAQGNENLPVWRVQELLQCVRAAWEAVDPERA